LASTISITINQMVSGLVKNLSLIWQLISLPGDDAPTPAKILTNP
jgi:hypothetical protein